MKFVLFVEGYTERALSSFLKRWLDPRLSRPVGVEPVRFSGSSDYLKSLTQRAKRDLDSGHLIAVIGLLDLYGASLEFPPNSTTDAKCAWAKAKLERQVGDSRFRQHFAVHETEAWLLSDPNAFPTSVGPVSKTSRTGRNRSTSSNRHRSYSRRSTKPEDVTIRKSLTVLSYSADLLRIPPMQSARIWHCSWTTCCHSPRQPVSDLRPARLNHSRHRRLSQVCISRRKTSLI